MDHDLRRVQNRNPSRDLRDADLTPMPAEDRTGPHDLEAHSEDLERYDDIRQKSLEMRNEGKDALAHLIEADNTSSVPPDQASRYYRIKTLRVALQTGVESINPEYWEKAFSYVKSLEQLNETPRSVLVAAESMRGLVATSGFALGGQVMRSWYWILRELFTASQPDWAVGGAAAGPEGSVSAFVTAQCVHAVMDLSESLVATHDLCKVMSKTAKSLSLISKEGVPEQWRESDRKRIAQSCRNTLIRMSPRLALRLTGIDRIKPSGIDDYINAELRGQVKAALEKALGELVALIVEVNDFRDTENGKTTSEGEQGKTEISTPPEEQEIEQKRLKKQLAESKGGHSIARSALEKAQESTIKAIDAVESKDDPWGKAAEAFLEASIAVREGLSAAQRFLSGIIDQQLAASQLSDGRQWEPAELVFAADAYWRLRQHEDVREDERIPLAASMLEQGLDANGTFVIRRAYYADPTGTHYFVASYGVLAALADLLRATRTPLNVPLVDKLLPDLERRRVRSGLKTQGWTQEYSTSVKAGMLETASGVEALVAINRYLDDGINEVILKHFSVRHSAPDGTGLDDLFYADYGFAQEVDASAIKQMVRDSSVMVFQRLRSQVTRTGQKQLHSLVLSGPAGTGKTTLVEALAQSCGVPLVEVTPSDLAKAGEAALERRARTVFKALSLLTHVVILFDEFDPILRRRDASGEKAFTYFSFLTPGMLPKLKNLSEKARERSVAYVLVTNLLGTLDKAAVRRGRFDERLAVFSPDPLSRLGRIAVVAHTRARDQAMKALERKKTQAEADKKEFDTDKEWEAALKAQYPEGLVQRVREVAYATGGLGMPQLTAKSWYRSSRDETLDDDTPLGYIFNPKVSKFEFRAEFEDEYDNQLRGTGDAAEKEAEQWWWLHHWDLAVKKLSSSAEEDVLQHRPREVGEIVGDQYFSKAEAESARQKAKL